MYLDTGSAWYHVRMKNEEPPKDWKMLKRETSDAATLQCSHLAGRKRDLQGDSVGAGLGTNRGTDSVYPCAADQGRNRGVDSVCASGVQP